MPLLVKLITNPEALRKLVGVGMAVAFIILSTKFEVVNQFLNAFSGLYCLCVLPALIWLVFLLIRWSPDDIRILRKQYCKNETPKRDERRYMAMVILLYHLAVFGQYATCVLLWIYARPKRPSGVITALNFGSLGAVGLAGLIIRWPLSRDDDPDVEAPVRKLTFVPKDGAAAAAMATDSNYKPEWQGGLFDLGDDAKGACLSFSCLFCVFGWNMKRIHLGSMYCQSITFLLSCLAPLLMLNMAAIHFHSPGLKLAFLATSIAFCFLGLLYGAMWRIRTRNTYNLPGNHVFCGNPNVADGLQWLFCSCCSLAQEIRTVDAYKVVIVTHGNLEANAGQINVPASARMQRAQQ